MYVFNCERASTVIGEPTTVIICPVMLLAQLQLVQNPPGGSKKL